jgi:ribosomal protein L11
MRWDLNSCVCNTPIFKIGTIDHSVTHQYTFFVAKLRLHAHAHYRSEEEAPGQIQQIVRLRIKSGSATSGPPIGPVLGQYAIPISKFCTEFNERTQAMFVKDVSVFVTLYYLLDGTYYFDLAIPISSICFSRAARLKKGSGTAHGGKAHLKVHRISNRLRGVITPYMLFEAIMYRSFLQGGVGSYALRAVFYKGVGTLRSIGLVPYLISKQ